MALVATVVFAMLGGWWRNLLDWAVVAIPALAGLVAWVMPVKETTSFHRAWLFVGGLVLSGLIYLQQWETALTHKNEIAKLATKEDVDKLPGRVALELQKQTTKEVRTIPGVANPSVATVESKARKTNRLQSTKTEPKNVSEAPPTDKRLEKGIEDIKSMLGSQRWGIPAEQLVTLTRRMSPFASTVNNWTMNGGDLITSILGNQDSNRFASGLIAALRAAGWNLPGSGMTLAVFTGNPKGLIVLLHSKEDANSPILDQLLGTLKESGVQFHGELRDDIPAGQFRILVGSKPE